MTTSRPYSGAIKSERAFELLRQEAGTQFDPSVVESFIRMFARDRRIAPGPTPATTSTSH